MTIIRRFFYFCDFILVDYKMLNLFSMFKRLLLGASGSINEKCFNVMDEEENVLCFDLCPTSEGLTTYVCEMFDINLDLELDPLSNIENDIMEYIAGFVSRKVGISENCEQCSTAVLTQNTSTTRCKFIQFKSNGLLFHPNEDLILISAMSEKVFRSFSLSKNLFKNNLIKSMSLIVLNHIFGEKNICFKNLDRKANLKYLTNSRCSPQCKLELFYSENKITIE